MSIRDIAHEFWTGELKKSKGFDDIMKALEVKDADELESKFKAAVQHDRDVEMSKIEQQGDK